MVGFEFYSAGRIVFGSGAADRLAELTSGFGARALLVLGGQSAERSGLRSRLEAQLDVGAIARCSGEPTVDAVDEAVALGREAGCDFVVAAGGGAVLDCGKAAAGMMTNTGSLEDYLEGVGQGLSIEAQPLPLAALPTTSGTGSEVTKNAVISGPGYKKSIRSPMLIPDLALVDPLLTHGMPAEVTASCGMDALTQLLEAYLSSGASPLTDGLALQGMQLASRSLLKAYTTPEEAQAREELALASLFGGLCLANAGLGAVHGFASPLGALFPIPHGVACAALLPQVVRANLEAARGTGQEARLRLRIAQAAEVITGVRSDDVAEAVESVVSFLEQLQRRLAIPGLARLGLTEARLQEVVAGARGSSMRYNPVELSDEQLLAILRAAM
jgi:alcohol dehydrogenase class IV